MDWFKIKVRHVLNTPFTNEEIGLLVKFQALVAQKESMPTMGEIRTIMRENSFIKLAEKLELNGIKVDFIGEKVLEDVTSSSIKRELNAKRVGKFRDKLRLGDDSVTHYTSVTVTPLDKIREDKSIKNNTKKHYIDRQAIDGFFENFIWKLYPKKTGKLKSRGFVERFLKTAKDEEDLKIKMDEMQIAVERYSQHFVGKDIQFMKGGDVFFGGYWQDWIHENPMISTVKTYRQIFEEENT